MFRQTRGTLLAVLLAAPAAGAAEVAVLKSSDAPGWRPALDALRRTTPGHAITEYDFRNDRGVADGILGQLKGRSVILVAMGPLAAQAAARRPAGRAPGLHHGPGAHAPRADHRAQHHGGHLQHPHQEPARRLPHGEPPGRAHRRDLQPREHRETGGGGGEGGRRAAPRPGDQARAVREGHPPGRPLAAERDRRGGRPLDPSRPDPPQRGVPPVHPLGVPEGEQARLHVLRAPRERGGAGAATAPTSRPSGSRRATW